MTIYGKGKAMYLFIHLERRIFCIIKGLNNTVIIKIKLKRDLNVCICLKFAREVFYQMWEKKNYFGLCWRENVPSDIRIFMSKVWC